jgi:hypothetical protein
MERGEGRESAGRFVTTFWLRPDMSKELRLDDVKARVEGIRITARTDITVLLTFSRRVAVGASLTLQLLCS